MKKFIKISLFLALTLLMASCDKKEEDTTDDTGFFYDVVYQTIATREDSTKSWVGVQGVMQMKFTQNTSEQGTFAFYYANYKEPQFVFNTCSGGYKGNFALLTETTSPDPDPNYNVLDPYNPGGSTGSTTEEPVTDPNDPNSVAKIQTYQFRLSITARNLDSACRSESDKNVLLYRFTNGEVIIRSEYRELRMRPVLTSESQL